MFSWEIQEFFESKNYRVTIEEVYDFILNTSPQVMSISLGECRDIEFSYKIATNDGYDWIVWLYNKSYLDNISANN